MDMFTIAFCGFAAYAGIALILTMMDGSNVSKGIIEGTGWVGYTLLCICIIASIVMLFF